MDGPWQGSANWGMWTLELPEQRGGAAVAAPYRNVEPSTAHGAAALCEQ